MRFLSVLFCLLVTWAGYAQAPTEGLTNNILTTKIYRKGLYKSLQEFRTNSPSDTTTQVSLKHRDANDIYWTGGTRYKLQVTDPKTNKTTNLRGDYFGYSTGDTLFVVLKGLTNGVDAEKLEMLGLYCYFTTLAQKNSNGVVAAGILGGAIGGAIAGSIAANGASQNQPYIMNINSGIQAMLTHKLANKLLEKDPELNAKYGPAENYQGDPSYFVEEYNQRHPELIKPF